MVRLAPLFYLRVVARAFTVCVILLLDTLYNVGLQESGNLVGMLQSGFDRGVRGREGGLVPEGITNRLAGTGKHSSIA